MIRFLETYPSTDVVSLEKFKSFVLEKFIYLPRFVIAISSPKMDEKEVEKIKLHSDDLVMKYEDFRDKLNEKFLDHQLRKKYWNEETNLDLDKLFEQ